MKSDHYTKAVLTVIALLLTVIAYKAVVQREPALSAQPAPFASVEFTRLNGFFTFFDTRTGEIWDYDTFYIDKKSIYGHAVRKFTLTKLGEPLGFELEPAGVGRYGVPK
ncbi:MAG TPA: hypothetical protein VIX89_13875 [Bryobacteraceae bacterium]